MKQIHLSAIIIAKNEEGTIKDAITSVQFCDEIVVIDNQSTDKTAQIAKNLGASVYAADTNDFSELRNSGLYHAKGDWVFYLDADEIVTAGLRESISKAVSQEEIVAYKLYRKNFYLGKHPWPHKDLLERLFQKKQLKKWHGALHESPLVDGPIGILTGELHHFSHKNLNNMLEKTILWSDTEAMLRFQVGHPPMVGWRFFRVMATAFYNSYVSQGGWKVGTVGIIESVYQAFSMFITYAKLWELQQRGLARKETEKLLQ